MEKITIYEKSTCSKCRETIKILDEAGVEYEMVEYYKTPLTEKKLGELLKKLNIDAVDLLRKKEEIYKKLKLGEKECSENKLIKYMVTYPDLMERPIIESGAKAVIGRPPENVRILL